MHESRRYTTRRTRTGTPGRPGVRVLNRVLSAYAGSGTLIAASSVGATMSGRDVVDEYIYTPVRVAFVQF